MMIYIYIYIYIYLIYIFNSFYTVLFVFLDTFGLTSLKLIEPPTFWADVENKLTFEITVSCVADSCNNFTNAQVIHSFCYLLS